ncbi:porin [uncultured Erythrobacter sp.]|uniref:OprO/OprP family phosphate-selective porin n=1 Tax=uncultured Erythrobacter sp. TaxID=263913 RepID=UPI002628B635|nr:porin [uncultured Erythrobacter sp.]
MKTHKKIAMVAAILSCSVSSQAIAQDSQSNADEIETLRAELLRLSQRIQELESNIAQNAQDAQIAQNAAAEAGRVAQSASKSAEEATLAANSLPEVNFKAAPEIKDGSGFTFKPRGRANIDAGYVSAPNSTGADSGFDAEARRIRLGASGSIPGGFGYKIEADFAEDEVKLTDAIVTYKHDGLTITAGQHNTFQGLEELSSSLHTSFIERSAWTDAFGFERRVGLSAQYKTGDVLVQTGVFSDNSSDLPNGNTSFDTRFVYAPKAGSTQLHFGGSVHYNDLGEGSELRYRQRPLVHFTDNRFLNTGRFSATSEVGIGLEAAAIAGPFHVALEGFNQRVNRPGDLANPDFLGASAEVGYFLTSGDKRGYKSGKFDRVKPANPVGEGGIGAVQLNLRYDYLDLNSQGIIGGVQDSVQASLIWTFTDYTRVLLNYGLLSYDDAAFPTATGDTSYNVHVFGARAQIDF